MTIVSLAHLSKVLSKTILMLLFLLEWFSAGQTVKLLPMQAEGVAGLAPIACARLLPPVCAYYANGSGAEVTLRDNVAAYLR